MSLCKTPNFDARNKCSCITELLRCKDYLLHLISRLKNCEIVTRSNYILKFVALVAKGGPPRASICLGYSIN
jgi:hypothetical protein